MFAREATPDVVGEKFALAGANGIEMRARSGHGQPKIGDIFR